MDKAQKFLAHPLGSLPAGLKNENSQETKNDGFNELVEDKTAVYISHRMSSCRFCDNIFVFDKGRIVQKGRHEALMREDGRYRELWNAQAQHYQ